MKPKVKINTHTHTHKRKNRLPTFVTIIHPHFKKTIEIQEEKKEGKDEEAKECTAFKKEMVDETLEKLEENKNAAKETITALAETVRKNVEKVTTKTTSKLDSMHEEMSEYLNGVVEEVKAAEFTEDFKKRAITDLKFIFTSFAYIVKCNPKLVLDILKKCTAKPLDCTTLKSFLASIPQAEVEEVTKVVNEGLLTCIYTHTFLF